MSDGSYFSIQKHATAGWMLYFGCGFCQHDLTSFKAAYRLAQSHIRQMHKRDKVKPQLSRLRSVVTFLPVSAVSP